MTLTIERTHNFGFVKVWLDKQTSVNCKSKLRLVQDNQLWALVLNFKINFFKSAAFVDGRKTNSTAAQSPARYVQLK